MADGRQDKEGYERLLNKSVVVFYQDGSEHSVGRKDGKVLSVDNDSLILLSSYGELLIPKIKIVRIEIK